MWVLDEFNTVEIPELHPVNFRAVGHNGRIQNYLTPVVGGRFVDQYQDELGTYEDVPLGRRTLSVDTLAKTENSQRMFTRWNNLRKQAGSYGRLYRRWAKLHGPALLGNDAVEIYERQWVWARMTERPLKQYGTFKWDGVTQPLSATVLDRIDPQDDHSMGHQEMEFIFETTSPYWRSESQVTVPLSLVGGVEQSFTFDLGELPIADAELDITNTNATDIQLIITSGNVDYTAWSYELSSGRTVINSGTDEVVRDLTSFFLNDYANLTYGATSAVRSHTHKRAPLIYIPNKSHTCYIKSIGGDCSVTISYYLSFKE